MKTNPMNNKKFTLIGLGVVSSFFASLCCLGPLALGVIGRRTEQE